MTDFSVQRLNMVDSQVRPSDVTDQRIVRAMLEVPRELFVPAEVAQLAYIDDPVPVTLRSKGAQARFLLPPRTLAKLVQLLEIGPQSAVLDVGCATGYSTAVLARLVRRVVALEADGDLARAARGTLERLGVANATVVEGPLAGGAAAPSLRRAALRRRRLLLMESLCLLTVPLPPRKPSARGIRGSSRRSQLICAICARSFVRKASLPALLKPTSCTI